LPLTSVPRIGLVSVAAFAQEAKAPAPTTPSVNVNAASAPQFEALPGIGPSMAQRIVAFREKNGPFKKLEDLMNVQGIGEKSFLKLRPFLAIGGQGDAKATKD
ncbi:ComEA family DNA-binding protein, partial [Luteitalea sp.]